MCIVSVLSVQSFGMLLISVLRYMCHHVLIAGLGLQLKHNVIELYLAEHTPGIASWGKRNSVCIASYHVTRSPIQVLCKEYCIMCSRSRLKHIC